MSSRLRAFAPAAAGGAGARGHGGAWGCGVFGNEPAMVADAFADALRVSPWFDRVVFAVLDRQRGRPTFGAFRDRLATGR